MSDRTDDVARDEEHDYRLCPSCPDGNEWGRNGPTGRACKTCGGYAVVKMNGEKLTKAEALERGV